MASEEYDPPCCKRIDNLIVCMNIKNKIDLNCQHTGIKVTMIDLDKLPERRKSSSTISTDSPPSPEVTFDLDFENALYYGEGQSPPEQMKSCTGFGRSSTSKGEP